MVWINWSYLWNFLSLLHQGLFGSLQIKGGKRKIGFSILWWSFGSPFPSEIFSGSRQFSFIHVNIFSFYYWWKPIFPMVVLLSLFWTLSLSSSSSSCPPSSSLTMERFVVYISNDLISELSNTMFIFSLRIVIMLSS